MPPLNCALRYVLAGNGLLLQAWREHINVLVVLASYTVRGLPPLEPYLSTDLPRISPELLRQMLEICHKQRDEKGEMLEVIFHFLVEGGKWRMVVPEQEQGHTYCRPVGRGEESYRQALLEIHSHHHFPAYFSETDDLDEQGGFRFLGVIGDLFDKPQIRLRLGIYGHFIPLPATFLLALPEGLEDALSGENVNLPVNRPGSVGNAVTNRLWPIQRWSKIWKGWTGSGKGQRCYEVRTGGADDAL
ncbi:MAG: hypothetical protein HXX08_14290 [Chloroflexi bacterium]|uniref:JAB domain-containing protein n=1 Tax=Candidatus Chlorohelix allophototropha TaxID=3003348 RepID=A0A8T7M4L4_9CHLR|nr:hypothetical protein [Chloroflexota bacterium]